MDELEELLRRYAPAGPPPELRRRIVGGVCLPAARHARSILREWIPAATALALATMFYWLAANQEGALANRLPVVPPIEQARPAAVDAQEWQP